MQTKRRNGRASTKMSVEDEIAHLRGLDLKGLRSRWHSVFQRQAPAHLTRHLLFAVIAYRIQADRLGDLDHKTRQVLDRMVSEGTGPAMSARLASFDQKRTEPPAGPPTVPTFRSCWRTSAPARSTSSLSTRSTVLRGLSRTSPSWSSCSMPTASHLSRSPSNSTPPVPWGDLP